MNQLAISPKSQSSRPLPALKTDACLDAYQRELTYIVRTIQRLGVPRDAVEDLAQDVFLVLHRTWSIYDPTRPIRAYLFGIIFRLASSHRRRRWFEIPVDRIETGDSAVGPETEFEARQAKALVLAALRDIPMPRRAVLVMHDLDLIPIKDVAATLSIPLFTAYSRLRKARNELGLAITQMTDRGRA